jgi:hypothetical protein
LNPVSTFTEEVFHWLLSTGKNCSVKRDTDDVFDLISIQSPQQTILKIILVDTKAWIDLNNRSAAEFSKLVSKQEFIRKQGISCVILWEDIWIAEKEIVKSRINALLGISQRIPGRTTKARRIDKPTAASFLNQNHLQHTVSSKLRYGLFLPNRYFRILKADNQFDTSAPEILVAVATFSHPRIFERNGKPFRSYELIRFANLLNTTVVGGFDKLLNEFIKDCQPDDIMTYADLEWSDGASYKRLGFEAVSDKPPMAFWLDPTSSLRHADVKKPDQDNLVEVFNAGSRKFVREILASFNSH